MKASSKWVTMLLLCLSGSIIYWGPFFSDVFYVPMRNAFGFSNTQIGILMSTFGVTSLIGYFPGGWLADRFPARKLICIGLSITAFGGFVFATIPSFEICLLIYGTWGLAISLVFWSAMIKATRNWGGRNEQGRAFGFLEGGRSLSDLGSATALLALFAFLGSNRTAVVEVLIAQALATLVLAVIVWLLLREEGQASDAPQVPAVAISIAKLGQVLSIPTVWLLAIVIMTAYSGYWGSVYLTPYATEVYELGEVWGGAIGTGKYWIAPIAAVAAGYIADRVGTAKTVVGAFVLMTAGFLLFGLVPGTPLLIPMLVANVVVIALVVFALRGIYFALLEEGGIPIAYTGTAAGIVSVIGYTPDIFVPPVAGMILDAYPGAAGYQILFTVLGILSALGLIAAVGIYREVQRGSNFGEISG